jgi:hypothetical protein
MRRIVMCLCVVTGLLAASCKEKRILTEEERLWLRVDSVKAMAVDGDLITRFNDNIVSHQVRFINESDKSYSHAGIVQTINDVKMVMHIDADTPGADTIKYEPLDSFINPIHNLACGLFRYDLDPEEKTRFIHELNNYHALQVHFDRIFVMASDSLLYCSEMIAKALRKATNDRILIRTCHIPQPMVKMVHKYLEEKYPIELVAAENIFTVDNLYLMPHCKEIIRFRLKQFPGQ